MRTQQKNWMKLAFSMLIAFLALIPTTSSADEGVIEISPTCATSTGCFSGDAPGWPITIDGSAGRHYRLTSPISVSNANTPVIQVSTSNISIDLGGFRIARNACLTPSRACEAFIPFGSAVYVDSPAHSGTRVFNGAVVALGGSGLELGRNAVVEDVQVRLNSGAGILVGEGATIRRVRSVENRATGITAGAGLRIEESIIARNAATGIIFSDESRVSRNAVFSNGQGGIIAGGAGVGSVVSENLVKGNQTLSANNISYAGIQVAASVVSANVLVTDQPGVPSVLANRASLLEDNVLYAVPDPAVITLDVGAGYRGNVFATPATITSGVNMGANLCEGILCP